MSKSERRIYHHYLMLHPHLKLFRNLNTSILSSKRDMISNLIQDASRVVVITRIGHSSNNHVFWISNFSAYTKRQLQIEETSCYIQIPKNLVPMQLFWRLQLLSLMWIFSQSFSFFALSKVWAKKQVIFKIWLLIIDSQFLSGSYDRMIASWDNHFHQIS